MAKRRWRVEYHREYGVWMAWPLDHTWSFKRGWIFESWEDAMEYAHSNGKAKHIKRTSPTGL